MSPQTRIPRFVAVDDTKRGVAVGVVGGSRCDLGGWLVGVLRRRPARVSFGAGQVGESGAPLAGERLGPVGVVSDLACGLELAKLAEERGVIAGHASGVMIGGAGRGWCGAGVFLPCRPLTQALLDDPAHLGVDAAAVGGIGLAQVLQRSGEFAATLAVGDLGQGVRVELREGLGVEVSEKRTPVQARLAGFARVVRLEVGL